MLCPIRHSPVAVDAAEVYEHAVRYGAFRSLSSVVVESVQCLFEGASQVKHCGRSCCW
jgi:hypothetical protein